MTMPKVLIKVLRTHSQWPTPAPKRMTEQAAGFDVIAAIGASMTLKPGDRVAVPCGFALSIPAGYEAQLRPRSGLAFQHGIVLLNAPATIDADYRGEVKVLLVNLSREPFVLKPGERIAQIVFAPIVIPTLTLVDQLASTSRGGRGLGSTGR